MTALNNVPRALYPDNDKNCFSELLKTAIYGFCFSLKEQVLATHREIAELRHCSEFLHNEPNRVVHIVAPSKHKQGDFIEKTLMHLGVSCGQIKLNTDESKTDSKQDIWLLVADR